MDNGKKNMECKNTYDALNMYNKSIVFAPELDEILGRACAERAACLLQLGDYNRALIDVAQVNNIFWIEISKFYPGSNFVLSLFNHNAPYFLSPAEDSNYAGPKRY